MIRRPWTWDLLLRAGMIRRLWDMGRHILQFYHPPNLPPPPSPPAPKTKNSALHRREVPYHTIPLQKKNSSRSQQNSIRPLPTKSQEALFHRGFRRNCGRISNRLGFPSHHPSVTFTACVGEANSPSLSLSSDRTCSLCGKKSRGPVLIITVALPWLILFFIYLAR